MLTFPNFVQTVPSVFALDVLVHSMWSTMIITGIIFCSVIFLFLSFKVHSSIKTESSEIGSIQISFLLSLSGFRYLKNHVRHHLFETPLLPRRRYSSLSSSWLSDIVKRMSFSSKSLDIFAKEEVISPPLPVEKKRRSSTASTESNSLRRSSSHSKSKRLSVPLNSASPPLTNTITPVIPATQAPTTKSHYNLRRNTLPSIPVSKDNIFENSSDVTPSINITNVLTKQSEQEVIISDQSVLASHEEIQHVPIQSSAIHQTVTNDSSVNLLSIAEEDEEEAIEESSNASEFSDESVISGDSSVLLSESDDDKETVKIHSEPVPICDIGVSSIIEQDSIVPSSPKTSYFRSSYMNYLPESIFGYSTGISKAIQAPTDSSVSAPPGFSKRSASHDFTHSNSAASYSNVSPTDSFNNHQPLYARRRTETAKTLSHDAEPFISTDIATKYPSFVKKSSTEETPIRTNSSSPCLIDLQNTEDLFAPINWNFSNSSQNDDALRRSWDSLDEEQTTKPTKPESRRQSTSAYSSIFGRY